MACGPDWGGRIGAVLARDNTSGRVTIRELPEGQPSERAGLALSDEVLAVDGKPLAPLSPQDISRMLRGPVGSRVTLRIRRDGVERDIVVERGPERVAAPLPSRRPER